MSEFSELRTQTIQKIGTAIFNATGMVQKDYEFIGKCVHDAMFEENIATTKKYVALCGMDVYDVVFTSVEETITKYGIHATKSDCVGIAQGIISGLRERDILHDDKTQDRT